MKSGKPVQCGDTQIVLCTEYCQGDQNIDNMCEPHAVNEEDENANNMKERKRERERRTYSGVKTHCVSQYDVDSSGSGLEPVRLVTLIQFSIPPTIHLGRYSPFRALVSLKTSLHSSLSSARLLHFRIPTICDVSLRTTFFHHLLGLTTGPLL